MNKCFMSVLLELTRYFYQLPSFLINQVTLLLEKMWPGEGARHRGVNSSLI